MSSLSAEGDLRHHQHHQPSVLAAAGDGVENHAGDGKSFTLRSLLVGLMIGTLITFSNTYFGLQTGWISSMAMPSTLIGFSMFKVLSKHLSYPFTPVENVLIQTVAGAVGTMPLGCGFVGVIPALEFLLTDGQDEGEGGPLMLNFWKLCLWSLGVCLFGVVFAVPLRREVIIREKLKFPSGMAAAFLLKVLHGKQQENKKDALEHREEGPVSREQGEEEPCQSTEGRGPLLVKEDDDDDDVEGQADKLRDWRSKMRLLLGAFFVSAVYVCAKCPLHLYDWLYTNKLVCRRYSHTLCPRFVTYPS